MLRNKGHIKNGGKTPLSKKANVYSKFKGRGDIKIFLCIHYERFRKSNQIFIR